jgi:hypothetical protein
MKTYPINHSYSYSYFALANKKNLLHEAWLLTTKNKYISLVTNDPQQAYIFRNREQAQLYLNEYENRLQNFHVVEISETITRTYKII